MSLDERATIPCDECGRMYRAAWFAPSDVWNRLVGGEGGQLCPTCFTNIDDIIWKVTPA